MARSLAAQHILLKGGDIDERGAAAAPWSREARPRAGDDSRAEEPARTKRREEGEPGHVIVSGDPPEEDGGDEGRAAE